MRKVVRFLVPLVFGLVLVLLAGCASMDSMDDMEEKEDMEEMSAAASLFFVYPGQANKTPVREACGGDSVAARCPIFREISPATWYWPNFSAMYSPFCRTFLAAVVLLLNQLQVPARCRASGSIMGIRRAFTRPAHQARQHLLSSSG